MKKDEPLSPAHLWLLVLLGICAIGLRLYGLQASYWLDEILTHKRANQPFLDVLASSTYPLSNILCHFALRLGDTESIMRLPNLLAGFGSLWLIFIICRRAFGVLTAMVALFLLTFSAYHITYSQDARYYSLLVFFGLCTLWTLYRFLLYGRWLDIIAFGFFTCLGLIDQPIFAPYACGLGGSAILLIVTNSNDTRGKRFARVAAVILTLALSAIPLLWTTRNFQIINDIGAITTPLSSREGKELHRLTVPEYIAFFTSSTQGIFAMYPAALRFTIFATAIFGIFAAYKWEKRMTILLLGAVIINPLPSLMLKVSNPYFPRYFICQFPIIIIFFSCGLVFAIYAALSWIARRWQQEIHESPDRHSSFADKFTGIFTGVFLLGLLPGIVPSLNHYYTWSLQDKDWKRFAYRMGMEITPDDVIVHITPSASEDAWKYLSKEPLDFYLDRLSPDGRPTMTPKTSVGINTASNLQSKLNTIATQAPDKTVWVVMPSSLSSQIERDSPLKFRLVEQCPKLQLRVLGRPTTNMVIDGGFESPELARKIANSKSIKLVKGRDSLYGTSLQFNQSAPGDAHIGLQIRPDTHTLATTNTILNASTVYTLSLWVKCENIRQHKWSASTGRLALAGETSTGEKYWKDLNWWEGTSTWQRHAVTIDPTEDPALADLVNLSIHTGIYGGSGKMTVDNIQLEPHTSPSPFTNYKRQRHDKYLQ